MLYHVTHTTKYVYTEPVWLCHNLVHLRPRIVPRQTCHSSQLLVEPEPRALANRNDYFGNPIALFTIQEPHRKLSIAAQHRIEVTPGPAIALLESEPWKHARPTLLEAQQYTFDSVYVTRSPELAAYAAPSFAPGRPVLDAVMDLTGRIHADFRYDAKATTLSTPLAAVLKLRHGVCRTSRISRSAACARLILRPVT